MLTPCENTIDIGAPEEFDSLEAELLPALPGEEEQPPFTPKFRKQHDSLRVAKHRSQVNAHRKKTLHAAKTVMRRAPVPAPQKAVEQPKKQETVPAEVQKPPPRTGESPTAPRGRNATRRAARMPLKNQSQ